MKALQSARILAGTCLSLLPALLLSGCWVPRGPIDLRETETKIVRVGVEAPRGGICPGEPVTLDIELTADIGWKAARLTRVRRDLDDPIFDMRQLRIASAQGRIDGEGRFFPDADPLVSAQSGFVLYVAVPRGPTFSVRYPPVYECATPFGHEGQKGNDGAKGEDALFEDRSDPSGTGVLPSANGFVGGDGGDGGSGPELTIYVTWVRTPDYTRLLAARAEGDLHGVTLRAPGTPLDVVARGGRGGSGGRGGQGASGLDEVRRHRGRGDSSVLHPLTHGGIGGTGGSGGNGGAGGSVRVIVDERFELEPWVHVDVGGGLGGEAGRGGQGGRGGASTHSGARETTSSSGLPGTHGRTGKSGANGHVTFERGDVGSRFEGLGAIVQL